MSDLRLFTPLGHVLSLGHFFRLFQHLGLLVWGMVFGVYILWYFHLLSVKAYVDGRLILDLKPGLETVSTECGLFSTLSSCETGAQFENGITVYPKFLL